MKIREYRSKDAADLARVMFLSVQEVAIIYYRPEQCSAWCPEIYDTDAFVARLTDGRAVFVAADEGDVVQAFIELVPDGYIDRFFCAPVAAGQGNGQALYAALEQRARDWRLARLHVDASEGAMQFFRQQGFQVLGQQEVICRGVSLHNYQMEKRLAGGGPAQT